MNSSRERVPGSLPREIEQPLYTAIGHLVVNWAFVEQIIDMWCTIAYQAPGGGQIAKELPRELSRKIKFLKACFRDMPALAPLAEEARECLARAKQISATRHFVIHGAIAGYEPSDHTLRFVRLDLVDESTMHQEADLLITAQQLLDQGTACLDLAPKMHRIGSQLLDIHA
jgi:hypothetical protein